MRRMFGYNTETYICFAIAVVMILIGAGGVNFGWWGQLTAKGFVVVGVISALVGGCFVVRNLIALFRGTLR